MLLKLDNKKTLSEDIPIKHISTIHFMYLSKCEGKKINHLNKNF